jgi:hypothetical protein
VNWRAIGCMAAGSIVFVAIGLLGLSLATSRVGCPQAVRWNGVSYAPIGSPVATPAFDLPGEPSQLGSTFIGLATREVYGPPGWTPAAPAAGSAAVTSSGAAATSTIDQPATIAMACGDGTYQTYRLAGAVPSAAPSASP